jgi:hypothetical protein
VNNQYPITDDMRMTMKPVFLILFLFLFQPLSYADVIELTPAQINNMQVRLATVSVDSSMQSQRYSAEVV